LPFGFLDHKLKCGNALVGCWFDRFQDYPAMAWDRDGGDKDRKKFVHHFRGTGTSAKGDKWTHAIKEQKEKVRAELVQLIRARRENAFPFFEEKLTPAGAHDHLVNVFEKLHSLPIYDYEERRREYEKHFGPGTAYRHLRGAFDNWCAIWFWPGDLLEHAPMPVDFLKPSPKALGIIHELRDQHRFFHWELEFPDVFTSSRGGFDAVIGNPPWEVQKPNSKEFFSNIDPLYRGYGKQEALDRQMEYCKLDATVEMNWLHYCARLKARSNWVKYAAEPFGDQIYEESDGTPKHRFKLDSKFSKSAADHSAWKAMRQGRTGYADPNHPFQHQGSADLNTYKMFLEAGHTLLRQGGRLGLLVPSGLYSDKGAGSLRRLFLKKSRWSHLYSFQNERFLFGAVHHSFKVAAVQVEKGGQSGELLTRFRLGPGDSPEPHELETDIPDESRYLPVSVKEIEEFSPHSGAILEIRSPRDLEIVKKLYANGVLLGDKSPDGWNIKYTREFDMTNDSKLFPPRWKWEDQGYRPDEYGHWLKGNWQQHLGEQSILKRPNGLILSADGVAGIVIDEIEDVALPLYQGGMINQFDFCASGYRSMDGKRGFKWQAIGWDSKQVEPQYLMSRTDYMTSEGALRGPKLLCRNIARTTDTRTFIGALVNDLPSGHSLAAMSSIDSLSLGAILDSFTTDWALRQRLAGTNLSLFVLQDLVSPRLEKLSALRPTAASLSLCHPRFAPAWRAATRTIPWRLGWAVTPQERLRQRIVLEVIVAHLFGLDSVEMSHLLADCDHPCETVSGKEFARALDPKGFWRVEKELQPELRLPVLTQIAMRDSQAIGFDRFLALNDDQGWMLPETVRLADYGLGHDDRAQEHQPVAAALGPRFYPWQLEQSVEESWEECERHAQILGRLLPAPDPEKKTPAEDGDAVPVDLFGNPIETDLFGNPLYSKSRKR
ncbi:MAG: hypothetical protein ABL995_16565, partial [Bryobacteraceae bacterium]